MKNQIATKTIRKNKALKFTLKKFSKAILVYSLVASLITPFQLYAAPQGEVVVAGNVNVNRIATTTLVNQLSNKAIINWQSFDISAQELVKFLQPGANSIALNRIVGGNATEILGQLSANGRLFILNPNGVVFGSTARIDAAGLLASTLDIKDADFLNDRFQFTQVGGNNNALVANQGEIKIGDGGFAFLVAPGVSNEGVIIARLGQVALASGNKMTINFQGNGLISYAVSGAVANKVTGLNNTTLASLVSNSGTIDAAGGHVLMKGASAGDVFSSVVNNSGTIRAQSLLNKNGTVVLSGGISGGTVVNTGTVDVSAIEANATGGEVNISGYFAGNSGTILAQGAGTGDGGLVGVHSTQQTITASTSAIDVSGGAQGNGGTVLLRSDNRVIFDGAVKAQGGAIQGDGGFVDASSPGQVELLGVVDATATNGTMGTLLIDPNMIDINNAAGLAYTAVLGAFATTPAGATVISATSINASAANVILQANTDITVTTAIQIATLGIGLTLQAGRSILVNANITTNNGNIIMTANDPTAVAANRAAGVANITMKAGTTIDAGVGAIPGNITLTVDSVGVAGLAAGSAGGVQVDSITTNGNLIITSFGPIVEVVPDAAVDLRANNMTLITTDPAGATIGSPGAAATDPLEIHVGTKLDITTTNGAVAIHSPGSSLGVPTFFGVAPVDNPATANIDESMLVDLGIGSINIGTATLLATVTDGSFLDATAGAGATPNITAGAMNLITNGGTDVVVNGRVVGNDGLRGGSIGTLTNALRTQIAILTASSSNQSIYINNTGIGLIINDVVAMQEGVAARNAGTAVTTTSFNSVLLVGANDVVITNTGDISLKTISATRKASLTSTNGVILDNNQDANNFIAKQVVLAAAGAIAQAADSIEIITEDLSSTTTSGSQYFSMTIPATISTIMAGAVGVGVVSDVVLTATSGAMTLGMITATGGTVSINAGQGSIVDGNGAAVNIAGVAAVLTAGAGVGTAADSLETTVADLTVDVSANAATSFYIAETDGLSSINAKVKQGDTNLTLGGGSFSFAAATGALASTGIASVVFENTGGDISIGTLNATLLGSANITALGAINSATSAITADTLTLTAGTNIGSALAMMNTTVNTATLNAAAGGIYVRETNALTITATAGGTASDMDIATAVGDLTFTTVSATGLATLNAAGSILGSTASSSVTASSAVLTAGVAIGSAVTSLLTTTSTVSATANAGGIWLSNSGDLTLNNATATGGAITLNNSGALVLGVVSAVGNAVTINNTGLLSDSNAAALNITAASLDISGSAIGAIGVGAIDVNTASLTASSITGAIYINSVGAAPLALLTVTAVGANAGIEISAVGDVALGVLTAKGDSVTLTSSAGAVTDGNAGAVNVVANKMTINALNGVGTVADGLETQVAQLSSGANSNVVNAGPLYITQASLQSGGSSFTADSITIADMNGAIVAMPVNASLNLTTTIGHIVFLNANDTIVASGLGSVTIIAGTTVGSGAVAVIGNIKTTNQNISIKADSHISIGLLDAGTANVRLESLSGAVLDSNGAANNIIATNVTIIGTVPSARNAQLNTINAIADANAKTSETAATLTSLDANKAALVIQMATASQLATAETSAISASTAANAAESAQHSIVVGLQVAKFVVDGITVALSLVAAITGTIAGVAQAVPFTGDGGMATIAAIADIAVGVSSAVSLGLDIGLFAATENLSTKSSTATAATANKFAATQDSINAVGTVNAANESISIIQAAYDKVVVARDTSWQVSKQAVLAENVSSTAGTLAAPFGIQATGQIDISAQNSDVALSLTGAASLGNITAAKASNDAFISIISTNNINLLGNLAANDYVRLQTTGAISNGGALSNVSAAKLVTVAGTGVGTATALKSSVDIFAANAGTGGVQLANQKALTIGTVDGVVGVTATTAVNLSAASPLTVSQNISSSAGAVSLTAGNSLLAGDDLTVAAVTVSGVTGVTLTAGDNIALATGSQITGGGVAITADNEGAAVADGVTGSITLAGNINGSSVNVVGGGVNQTGAIVSTGLVSIGANSTATSAISGISLASVLAAGTVDAISSHGLTLTQNVKSTGGAITLTAGTNVGSVDNLTIGAVTVDSIAGVTMTAGDNITLATGGLIKGTAVVMIADNGADGFAAPDSVTGSVVLAGDVNATSVTISGGGVNQTGAISSTGLVNIAANSTAASTFSGINLALITAGTTIDAVSSHGLAVTKNLTSTGGGAITLTSSANAVSVDHLTVDAVTISTAGNVTMSAGDNITTALGSVINGAAVAMTANSVGDGVVDTVGGSLLLAGNINGASVTIAGGGVNQTGAINSTGLVNISANSTAASVFKGISLALINAGTSINAVSSHGLTLTKNVSSTGAVGVGNISLTAGTNVASVDDLTVGAVTINTLANVTMTAGDNITTALGSQINGAAILMTADNTGDGLADGVSGGLTLAGNMSGTSVNIIGGGLNQTGSITSTGLVNIATTSTASSPIKGATLALIQAGGTIDVLSSHGVTVNKNVNSTGGAITMTAGNNIGSIDNLTIGAVAIGSTVGNVTLIAGDNITALVGSTITGSAIALTADNAGDGSADTVSGSLTLAGAINARTSVNIIGGGVNHTGSITSAGPVTITANSTAASPFKGISLALIQATGALTATSSNSLAVTQNISSSAGAIALVAGTNTATVDDLTIAAVNVTAATGVTLTSGDNISTAANSQITGTAIVMTADNTGDGFADGVSGSLTLAGKVNGSSVNITGGGLNQTGAISSTGLVNIIANSTAASAFKGISLALIDAGTSINAVSSHGLTLTKNVSSTGAVGVGNISLTAGTDVARVDNLTIEAITINTLANVTMAAGDNITTALGSQINGAAIVMTSDNAGDGVADGVGGSLTLAGNMSGSSVTITGGGVNQTGSITSTGLVNIAANSTPASSFNGINLALINAGGTIDAVSSNHLTLTQNVVSTGGAIALTAGTNAATVDDLVIGAVNVDSVAGVTMTAGDNITTAVGSLIKGTAVSMTANNAGDGIVDTVGGSLTLAGNVNGSASVTMAGAGLNHSGIITSTGGVNIATASNAASVVDGIKLGTINAAGQTVNIAATGTATAAITDNNGLADNVLALNLAMLATAGVGTAVDAIESSVFRLASSGGTGGVALTNTGNLTLGAVGPVTALSATAGAINLSTVGNLGISDGFVQGAGLNVALLATGGSITEVAPGVAADVVGLNIDLRVTGAGSTIGTVAQRLELDATTLTALTQGGSMYLEDTAGGVAVGTLSTTLAAGSVIDMLVTGGSLTEKAPLFPNVPHVVTDALNIAVTGVTSTIGTPNQYLEVDVNLLNNITTQGGGIYITDITGGVAINNMTTLGVAGSEIAVTSLNGSILESTPADLGVDLNADIVSLQVNAPNSNIGTAAQPLEINANTVNLNNLWGLRSFVGFPNVVPGGPQPTVTEPKFTPPDLMLVNGNVVGGANIAAFIEAQSTVSSSLSAALFMLSVGSSSASFGQSAGNSSLVGFGSGYWGGGQ